MKRRLKNELLNRSQLVETRTTEETRNFEESLLRLAQLAKGRVRMVDFTNNDKYHLLDLFVNNEQTLLKMYEALFPNKQANNIAMEVIQQSYANGLNQVQTSEAPTLISDEARSQHLLRGSSHTNRRS